MFCSNYSSPVLISFLLLLFLSFYSSASLPSSSSPPNLLFIVVDDLRPELPGSYGIDQIIAPSITRLMNEGTTFTRAFCQVSVCSPSRTSFLTGMRSKNNRIWTIGPYFRDQAPNASSIITLTQALMQAGYNTTGAGKVWHPGTSSGGSILPEVGGDDMPYSWSYPNGSIYNGYFECDQYYNGTFQSPRSVNYPGGTGCIQSEECIACYTQANITANFNNALAPANCPDNCFPDGAVADRGILELQYKAQNPSSNPWALFLGMKRPHLNFFAPTWAYGMYSNGSAPIATHRYPPDTMPEPAFFQNGEIAGHPDTKPYMYTYINNEGKFTLLQDWKHYEIRWAYRSSVTYMDRQVGNVLDTLESLQLRNNTFIIFFGDHGWSLGENGEFAKQNLFEMGTRVPLIIVPPSDPVYLQSYGVNKTYHGIVELLDVYPTILDILNISGSTRIPSHQLEGNSLLPVLLLPNSTAMFNDNNFSTAFSEISRGDNQSPTTSPPDGSIHGLSVRTTDWRFNVWLPYNYTLASPLWSEYNGSRIELYDHRNDTGNFEDYNNVEYTNLAFEPQYATIVQSLLTLVQSNWP